MTDFNLFQWMIDEKIARNGFNASAIMNGLELWKLESNEAKKARIKLYRDHRNSGETSKVSFAKAIAGEPVLADDAEPMFEGAMLSE